MSHVSVSDIKVCVIVGGREAAQFDFYRVDLSPQNWEIIAAIIDVDSRKAIRACLLACIAELSADGWEAYTFEAQGAGETNDQPQLPWE